MSNATKWKRMQLRDRIGEGLIANYCQHCGKSLVRKTRKDGLPESLSRFRQRRSCGMEWSKKENKYIKTECLISLALGDKNGNWKGGKNDCKICGNKVGGYPSKHEPQIYCYKCYQTKKMPFLHQTNPHTFKKGHIPKCPFKKGRVATNKLYDFCTIKDCGRKHVAKGLCGKHYQSKNKLLLNQNEK